MWRGLGRREQEHLTQISYVLVGSLLYAFAMNVIITPLGLYSGGFYGIAQLIRTFLTGFLKIHLQKGLDLAGIIYFLINIPLLYMAYRVMGKSFFVKTLVTVIIQSFFLAAVPIPDEPIVSDYLTACLIGGIVSGTGSGMVLRGRSSAGGQDILGICFAKKNPDFSVGKLSILMNFVIYMICLFLFNIEIVIYSLIYAMVHGLAVDRVHIQNINMSVMIFTKKEGIQEAIMQQMNRGVTNWEGMGAYTQDTASILYVVISKYEVAQIKRVVHSIDQDAFMILTEGCSVDGNFEKRL
ncbi:MAG: YitT family protein [Hespellia sp.]|nr:YitT family protein [Hespellia sp.]